MRIDDILKLWEKDCVIDATTVSNDSISIARLHHKYYSIYIREKLKLDNLEIDYKEFYKERWKFYNKMGNPEELDKYKDDDFFDRKFMKSDKDIFIDADKAILEYKKKISIQQEKVDLLKSILNMVSIRSYQIKNFIEYMKFQNGN